MAVSPDPTATSIYIRYLYPHTQLDAQISYAISRRFLVALALLNLNNEVFGLYHNNGVKPPASSVRI
jgi:hypothetical protein